MVSVSVPIRPFADFSLSMSNPPFPPNNNLSMNPSMTDGDAVSLLQTLGMILTPYQDQSNAHLQMQMYMQMQQQLQQMAAVNTINAAHHAQAQVAAAVSNQASIGRGMSLSLPGHPHPSNPLLPSSSQHAMSSSSSLPYPTNPFTTHVHNTSPPTHSPESSPHSSDEHISHHGYPSDGSREEEDENWQQHQPSQLQSQQHGTNHINTNTTPAAAQIRTHELDHTSALSRQSTVTSTSSASSGSSTSHSSNTRLSPSRDAPSSSSSSNRPTSFHSSAASTSSTSGSRPSESPLSSESPSQSSPSPPIGNNSRATFPFLPGLAALAAPQPKKKRNPKKPGLTREQRLHNRKLAHRQIDANRRLRLAAGFAQLQAVVQPNAAQPLSQIQLLRRSSTLMLELTSERERLQQLLQQMTEDRKEREERGSEDGQGQGQGQAQGQTKKIKIKREKIIKPPQQQQQIDGGEQVTSDGHHDQHDAHLDPDDQRQVRARSISHPTPNSSSSFPTSMSLPTLPSWQDTHGLTAHPTHTPHPHPHPHPHPSHPQLNSNYPHDGHMDSAFVNPLQHPMAFAFMQQQGHSLGYPNPNPHAATNTPAISPAPNHMHMSMPMSMHMPMAMSMPLAMPIHHPHHPQPHHPSTMDSSHISPFTSPSMSRRTLDPHPIAEADPNTNSINDHLTGNSS